MITIPIDEQTILVDQIPRLATGGYVFYWKKNPFIFLPSWSVEPLSAKGLFKESDQKGTNKAGYRLLLAAMEQRATKPKTQIGGVMKWILGLGLAAIIIYAFISGGG